MQYTLAIVPALMAVANGMYAPRQANSTGAVYVTETVTALTTYCPSSTTIVQGSKTYTVTKATTLTITDCPCTVVKPMTAPGAKPPTNGTVAGAPYAPAAPGVATSVGAVSKPSTAAAIPGSSVGAVAVSGSVAATAVGPKPSATGSNSPTYTIATAGGSKAGVAVAGIVAAGLALVA